MAICILQCTKSAAHFQTCVAKLLECEGLCYAVHTNSNAAWSVCKTTSKRLLSQIYLNRPVRKKLGGGEGRNSFQGQDSLKKNPAFSHLPYFPYNQSCLAVTAPRLYTSWSYRKYEFLSVHCCMGKSCRIYVIMSLITKIRIAFYFYESI